MRGYHTAGSVRMRGLFGVAKYPCAGSFQPYYGFPHVWGSGIALAAALHAIVNIPRLPHTANPVPLQNEPVIEYDKNRNPLRDDLLNEKLVFEDGQLVVAQGPGLGVSINMDELADIYTPRLKHAPLFHA